MALDKNLFTLNIESSKIEPTAVDLVDPSGTVHYRKRLEQPATGIYLFSLSEPLSDSLLATVTAPAATSKEKTIELHNPSATVKLKYKGTLTFKWVFSWEEHEFEWKREACYMIRKPDPPVLVAVTKEPTGKIKTSTIQILDYNLNRFDIEDRKGLEIVLLTSLLTFSDYSEQTRGKSEKKDINDDALVPNVQVASVTVPTIPAKPEGWEEDQIAILQAKEQRDINEVVIGEMGEIDEYVKYCVSLLSDETIMFITLMSLTPACVSRVVQVAEATKRTHYKNIAYDDSEELHQYVVTSEVEDKKAKGKGRRINLDDTPPGITSSTYKPPTSLKIHLSKISMPELEPKSTVIKKPTKETSTPKGKHGKSVSEPDPRSDKKEKRKSAILSKSTKAATSGSGLRSHLSSLSLSPTPEERPSSAPGPSQPPPHAPLVSRSTYPPGKHPQPMYLAPHHPHPAPPRPPNHFTRPPQSQVGPPPVMYYGNPPPIRPGTRPVIFIPGSGPLNVPRPVSAGPFGFGPPPPRPPQGRFFVQR